MKAKKIILAIAALGVLPCLLMAGDATTDAVLVRVAGALRPVMERLDPKPTVEYPEHYPSSIRFTYLPQMYKVHGRLKTGGVSTNTFDEIGPSFRGLVLRVDVQNKGEANQACTPQTIREPYWLTDLDVIPVGQTDRQIFWVLSYAGGTPTNVLADMRATLRQMEESPNRLPGN